MKNPIKLIVISIIVLITACNQKNDVDMKKITKDWIKCPDEKIEMCATIHQPVMGLLKDGKTKEFSNSCMACKNENVTHYKELNKK